MLSLRLAANLASARHAGSRLQRGLASLHGLTAPCRMLGHAMIAPVPCSSTTSGGGSLAAAAGSGGSRECRHQQALQRRRRLRGQRLVPSASFSVVTGPGGSGTGGGSGGGAPWRLIIYSKEGCHLCDGLKEKVEALLDRAQFMPSALSSAQLEVRDITSNPEWEQKYAMAIPVLAAAAEDGSGEVEVPRPSPRFSADALQKHIEKFIAAQRQQQ